MSMFRPLAGKLIVIPEKDEDRTASGLVLFSDNMRRKRASGLVLLHQMSFWWERTVPEGLLDGEHVLFEKWAWKEFVLGTHELWIVPERAIFATVEGLLAEELRMTRDELIEELKTRVEDIVKDTLDKADSEVTEDACEEIDAQLDGLAAEALASDNEAEEEARRAAEDTDA